MTDDKKKDVEKEQDSVKEPPAEDVGAEEVEEQDPYEPDQPQPSPVPEQKEEPDAKSEAEPARESGESDKKGETQERMKKVAESAASFAVETGKKAGESMKALWEDPLVCTHHLDGFINWVRDCLPSELYLIMARAFVKLGHVGIVLAGISAIVFGVLGLLRVHYSLLIFSICYAVALIVAQYIADRFLRAGDSVVQSTPGKIRSAELLPSIALLCMAAEVAVVCGSIVVALYMKTWNPIWKGAITIIMLGAVEMVSIHPSLLNIEVDEESSAGEEVLGICSYLVKVVLRTTPIAFGLLSAFGTVLLGLSTIAMVSGEPNPGRVFVPAMMVLYGALLPLAVYLGAALYRLIEDLFKALLSLNR